jgi:hypothetical protein
MNNTKEYTQPELAILGQAADLVQSDKDGIGEPAFDAQQKPED